MPRILNLLKQVGLANNHISGLTYGLQVLLWNLMRTASKRNMLLRYAGLDRAQRGKIVDSSAKKGSDLSPCSRSQRQFTSNRIRSLFRFSMEKVEIEISLESLLLSGRMNPFLYTHAPSPE